MKNQAILTTAVALLVCGAATANVVLVAENFDGLISENLPGRIAPTFSPDIVAAGGSATWAGSAFFKRDGSVVVTNNTGQWQRIASLNLGSYLNDAKGESDGLFELSITISEPPTVTGYLSLGFSAVNSPTVSGNFATAAVEGIGTVIYRDTGIIDAYGGLGAANRVTDGSDIGTGARTLTVTVDLRGHNGVDNFGSVSFSDSELGDLGSYTYTQNQNFGSILLSLQSPAFSPATMAQYSNLTLTRIVESADPPILTITPAVAPATGFDLEWNSKSGKSYNLRSSTGLDTPIAEWAILEADIAAEPPVNLVNVQAVGPVRFYAVEEFDAPPLLEETFEEVVGPAPPAGWTRSDNGAGTAWEVGTPAGGADFVPAVAAVGTQCAGTNINAQYTANAEASLISPAFTVPLSGATLAYWQYIDTETDPSGDLGSIRLLDADDNFLADVVTGIEGITTTWTQQSVDLPTAANGLEVKLEFRFTSDETDNWGGFYIDDVVVTAK